MGETRNSYRLLVGEFVGGYGRTAVGWEEVRETGCEDR
jgi:hypothetical protein